MTIIEFIEEFKRLYPEFKEEIEDEGYDGLVYLQAGIIRNAINDAGTDGTLDFVSEVLAFIGEMVKHADDKLKNVISVSILEHLEIEREQIDQMPEMLKELYNGIMEYNKETEQWFKEKMENDPEFRELFK